jgi:hypothetical protein
MNAICRLCGTSEGLKLKIFDPERDYVSKIHQLLPIMVRAIGIVLYCIYSAFKTSLRRIQNIVKIQHTDNNKYIKFEVLNIIIKTKLKI